MSSSPRVTRLSSPVFEVGISPSPLGTADATLASANDNPAAPNTGRALLRRFSFEVCFAWGIVHSFPPRQMLDRWADFLERRQYRAKSRRQSSNRHVEFRKFLTKPVILDKSRGDFRKVMSRRKYIEAKRTPTG